MAKVKRSQILTYIDVATDSWKLLGSGVVNGAIAYNPKILEETYIHEDSATISVESYAPKMAIEATAVNGDDVFEFIDQLRKDRAVLDDAETYICNVWMYETGSPPSYPAEKQKVAVSIEEFGGAGGESAKVAFTLNFVGAPIAGNFNVTTKAFTPS